MSSTVRHAATSFEHEIFEFWAIRLGVLLILLFVTTPCLVSSRPEAPRNDCYYARRVATVFVRTVHHDCCKWLSNIIKCQMSSVMEIDFSGRNLTGSLRGNMIRHLKNLTRLDLSNNSLTGTITNEIWNLPKLQYLNLSWNKFDGNLALNHSAAMLQNVDLSHNNLPGNCFALCIYFRNLSVLNISSNRFTQLDLAWSSCTSLQTLHASNNRLQGQILANISQVRKLTALVISHNQLSGSILALKNLTNLQVVDLSFNRLSGRFPEHIVQLLPTLRSLNVSNNYELNGWIDAEAWNKFGASAFQNTSLLENQERSSPAETPSQMSSGRPAISLPAGHIVTSRFGAGAIFGFVAGGIAGFVIILLILAICKRRRRKKWQIKKPAFLPTIDGHSPDMGPFNFNADSGNWVANVKDPNSVPIVIFEKPLLNLTFADLLQVISSFDKVAEVGVGTNLVYKCVLPGVLPEEEEVAIKVFTEGRALKDEEAVENFQGIGKIKHENIVPLLGYCIVGEVKLLIYKFMQNGTLQDRLHVLPEGSLSMSEDLNTEVWEESQVRDGFGGETISWGKRYKIAVGVARALAFLHHGCSSQIVHKGVSSTNILLDQHFEPHLACCWLANPSFFLLSRRKTEGYLPPEYSHSWNPTTRGDVYSFGVVLLELVTGKRPVGKDFCNQRYDNIVSWVRYLMKEEKKAMRALDARLVSESRSGEGEGEGSCCWVVEEMVEVLKVGYLCTAESPVKRPTMQQVVGLLKDVRVGRR